MPLIKVLFEDSGESMWVKVKKRSDLTGILDNNSIDGVLKAGDHVKLGKKTIYGMSVYVAKGKAKGKKKSKSPKKRKSSKVKGKKCLKNQVRDPSTKRCRLKRKSSPRKRKCSPGKSRSRSTGRCRKRS